MALCGFSAVFLMLTAAKGTENRDDPRCEVGHTFAEQTESGKKLDSPVENEVFCGFLRLTWPETG
jgi:hypothetical protein